MKKALSLLVILAITLSLFIVPAAAADDDTPAGIAIQGTPVIDGEIDTIWADAPVYPIDRLKDGRDTGITSQFRAMWQPDALYVLIEVNDSDHNFNGGPSVGDGMEVYFDLMNLKTAGFEDDYQAYFAMCADDENYLTYDGSPNGQACLMDAATVALTTSDDGYVYEAQILLEEFETKFTAGQTIGFDIQVNDQASGDTSRSGAYGWSDDVNNAWQGTMLYGNLTLEGGDAPAASSGLTEILAFDYKECGDNTNEELQYNHEDPDVKTALSLKPLDGVDPVGTWYDFDISVAGEGDVEFTFLYAAKDDRYMDVTFNGETKQVTCPNTGNFQTFDKVSVSFAGVPAGTQTLRIAAPADYSDTHKTPNIDVIWYGAPGASSSAAPAASGDIVRDGLVAWYDGANNQNGSQDKQAKIWKDCSGNGLDFEVELNDTNYWTDKSFHLDSVRNYLPDELVDVVNGDTYTVEFVAGELEYPATDWVSLIISDNDHFSLFIRVSNDNLEYKYNDANKDRPKADDGAELVNNSTVAVVFDINTQDCWMYVDGVLVSENVPAETNIADTLMLGHEDPRRIWSGDVYGMRFYNRALSPEEIAQNAAADNAKYRGGAPLPTPTETPAKTEQPAEESRGFKKLTDAAAAVGMTPITGYEWEDGTNGFGGEGPENLWDGSVTTKFCTNEFPAESEASLDATYKVTGFTMATANDNAEYNGRSPNAWTISVSADGENWTVLAEGDDSFFEEKNQTYYNGEGTAENVAFVKFEAEGTASGTFQVSEVTLYGEKTGEKPAKPEPVKEEPKAEEPAKTEEPAAEPEPETPAETPTETPPETPAEKPAEKPAETKKSGCGSMIGGGFIVLVTVLGSAWVAKRR